MDHKHWFIFDSPVVLRTFSAIFSPATMSFCIWLWKIKLTTIPIFCKLQMQIVQRCPSDQDIDFFGCREEVEYRTTRRTKKRSTLECSVCWISDPWITIDSICGMFVRKFRFRVCPYFNNLLLRIKVEVGLIFS